MITPIEIHTLRALCLRIESGYAEEKCGLDDDMVTLLIELADNTDTIRAALRVAQQAGELATALTWALGDIQDSLDEDHQEAFQAARDTLARAREALT
jgi:hypothetical protein